MRQIVLLSVLFILIVVVLWSGSWILIATRLSDWNERSAFGGMFGAIGALFSGLAFAGLIVTIIFQAKQLALQQQQIKDAREELKAQNEVLKQQRFENTFFQLLKLHTDIVNSIDTYTGSGSQRKGRDSFVSMYQEFRNKYQERSTIYEKKGLSGINEVYTIFYRTHRADLGHYFRNLYHLVKFVHRSDITNKRDYTRLIRAQLSTHEQLLLFYNCLSEYGVEKFKPLIETYDLLQNMPTELLIFQDHLHFYEAGKDRLL